MTSPLHGEGPGFKSPWAHFNSQTSSMITIGNLKKFYSDFKEQLSDDQA